MTKDKMLWMESNPESFFRVLERIYMSLKNKGEIKGDFFNLLGHAIIPDSLDEAKHYLKNEKFDKYILNHDFEKIISYANTTSRTDAETHEGIETFCSALKNNDVEKKVVIVSREEDALERAYDLDVPFYFKLGGQESVKQVLYNRKKNMLSMKGQYFIDGQVPIQNVVDNWECGGVEELIKKYFVKN